MSRNIIKRSATLLGAAVTTGALVLSMPSLAQAATYNNGNSDSERSAVDGTGDADARANATDGGKLRVFTEADGGDAGATPLPGGATSAPTRATATASLQKRIPVADGTYRVVFKYEGLQGKENDRGSDSNARVVRDSKVRFVAQSGGENRTVNRVQQVPDDKGNRRTVLLINVPNNSSGFLRVKALLRAQSSANGEGNFAHGDASASDVSFKVNRV